MFLTLYTFFSYTAACIITEYTVLNFDEKLFNQIILINDLTIKKFYNPRYLKSVYVQNIILIFFGILISFILTYFEVNKYWGFYMQRDYSYLVQFFAVSSLLLRTIFEIIFFLQFFSYIIIIGLCYNRINETINCYRFNKEKLKEEITYLKFLKSLDNSLKDFTETIILTYSIYNLTTAVLTFFHLIYTVAFFLLKKTPEFITFQNWIGFFIVIFIANVVACDLSKWQVIFLINLLLKKVLRV